MPGGDSGLFAYQQRKIFLCDNFYLGVDRLDLNLSFCKRDMAIATLRGFLYLLPCIVSTTLRLFNVFFLQLENNISDLKHTDLLI